MQEKCFFMGSIRVQKYNNFCIYANKIKRFTQKELFFLAYTNKKQYLCRRNQNKPL